MLQRGSGAYPHIDDCNYRIIRVRLSAHHYINYLFDFYSLLQRDEILRNLTGSLVATGFGDDLPKLPTGLSTGFVDNAVSPPADNNLAECFAHTPQPRGAGKAARVRNAEGAGSEDRAAAAWASAAAPARLQAADFGLTPDPKPTPRWRQ